MIVLSNMNELKNQIAAEIGIPDFEHTDKTKLSAQITGKIGGQMVRRMMQLAQQQMQMQEENS